MSEEDTYQEVIIQSCYFLSGFLFLLSLGGLSHQESSKRGNYYGVFGMSLAVIITFFTDGFYGLDFAKFLIGFIGGGVVGLILALRVQMTSMPQMVAILHSFVGIAATIVGYASFLKEEVKGEHEKIQLVETFLGVFIGAVTFSGSVVAFLKLDGKVGSQPLIICGCFRHVLNLTIIIVSFGLMGAFIAEVDLIYMYIMTGLALFLGWHLVMAIGGADMPVVVSMLNSYSGWATSASGFMLNNRLLIISGALIGSSGAILSYIMCRAMNRSFFAVIAGGFGIESSTAQQEIVGEIKEAKIDEVVDTLYNAKNIIVVPGYGMAVSRAQNTVGVLVKNLRNMGKKVRFCIHPVAGRLPGHMNVLLAEADVPYDIVMEMDHINKEFSETDVVFVIGANDIVNPEALENPRSPIAGMPVCEVWKAKRVFVNKRGKGKGYAAIENPLFFKDNTRMFYGDANPKMQEIIENLAKKGGIKIEAKIKEEKKEIEIQIEDLEDLSQYKNEGVYSIGVPKEILPGERRVSLVPSTVRKLVKLGFEVNVEKGAGLEAGFRDEEYIRSGAQIKNTNQVFSSNIVIKIRPVRFNQALNIHESELLSSTTLLISYIFLLDNPDLKEKLKSISTLSVFALECTPRITRAQKLDTLSSMTNLSGYRAVLEAYNHLPRFSKSQITAAGKIPPSKVFVIGAGVAGLAAIGVAKSLGAIIRAFDSRSVVKEQIESLGAEFVEMDYKEEGAGTGGYGKAMSEEFYDSQRRMILKQAKEVDIIVTTALIPNQKAPLLITAEIARAMKSGSVIVDLAAERGGNCELTRPGESFMDPESGVHIIGYFDYPSRMAKQSSELFSVNMYNLLEELMEIPLNPKNNANNFKINPNDEIQRGLLIFSMGEHLTPAPIVQQPAKPQQKPEINGKETKKETTIELVNHKGGNPSDYHLMIDTNSNRKTSIFKDNFFRALSLVAFTVVLAVVLGIVTDINFIINFGIFILSIFSGYLVIWNVTPALHTPLMSVTNAISGIIVIGCMLTINHFENQRDEWFLDYSICGFIGVLFASINVVGGFVVTQKMLRMFRK